MIIPRTMYRLQFYYGFSFDSAMSLIPYLKELGISHIYASPITQSKHGSMHGYDTIDPGIINPEFGGKEKFDTLIEEGKKFSIGWIQDVVSGHMAYDSENRFLMDVIEKGEDSPWKDIFDIDWKSHFEGLKGRLLSPFLGEFYGTCLDNGDLHLQFGENGFYISYKNLFFPIKLDDYPVILKTNLFELEQACGKEHDNVAKWTTLLHDFENLATESDRTKKLDKATTLKNSLIELHRSHPAITQHIEAILSHFNGEKNVPPTMNELDLLLARQNFRLSYWKVSNEEVNYRRFFTVNNLIALNTTTQETFNFSHNQIHALVREKKIDGLRIDHLDGLNHPHNYLLMIRKEFPDLYLIAEKILNFPEDLPTDMPIQGTTGYDFLNCMNGLFVHKKNMKKFDELYIGFTGLKQSYEEIVIQKKHLFMDRNLAGDIDNLVTILKNILGKSRYGRDMTHKGIKIAITEILAQFPIYRTYVFQDHITERDECYIRQAVKDAKNSYPGLKFELELVERILLLEYGPETPPEERLEWITFAQRFQQISTVLMAKGVEDTVFYVYNRLLSLNEVGGNPAIFGFTPQDFHRFTIKRMRKHPSSWNTSATHDTKRGEDVRARLNVLSEVPHEWARFVKASAKINAPLKRLLNNAAAPDRNEEYFIYQMLIGAFPFLENEFELFIKRMELYLIKSLREAKTHSSWNTPNSTYENACLDFLHQILDKDKSVNFWAIFSPFQKKIASYGIFNSLSQLLLKITAPGVCDIYQGTELWDFSMVDPDNRRNVDYETRIKWLQEIQQREIDLPNFLTELWKQKENGKIKLFTLYKLLRTRSDYENLFKNGDYIPLTVQGSHARNIVAYARKNAHEFSLSVVPRFLTQLVRQEELPCSKTVWNDTALVLPCDFPTSWVNAISGKSLDHHGPMFIGDILDEFPIGLLISKHPNNSARAIK